MKLIGSCVNLGMFSMNMSGNPGKVRELLKWAKMSCALYMSENSQKNRKILEISGTFSKIWVKTQTSHLKMSGKGKEKSGNFISGFMWSP